MEEVVGWINRFVSVPLIQNQFDALASYIYNAGIGSFLYKSGILQALNAYDYGDVPSLLRSWDYNPRRRAEEAFMFRQGIYIYHK